MKIVVLVKEVPDTWGTRRIDVESGLTDRAGSEPVLDEINERALEVALSYRDKTSGVEVLVLSMGPATAITTIRKALAMGADSGTLIADDALSGADMTLTAQVLASALQRTGFDLVIAGNLSTDGGGGVVPVMIAELLDVASATFLDSVEIDGDTVSGNRATETLRSRVSAALPAVISITEQLPDARFPNFKGIMAAKKKPVETVTLVYVGIDPNDPHSGRSIVTGVVATPPRQSGLKIVDSGDAGEKLAEFLLDNRLA